MGLLRCTVTLDTLSGINRDESKNIWHFATGGPATGPHRGRAAAGLLDFYGAISTHLGPELSRQPNAHRIDVAEVFPGSPGEADDTVSPILGFVNFSLPGSALGGIGFPAEVAIVLSFAGDLAGVPEEGPGGLTRPRSRRRGRVFLGPIAGGTAEADATSRQVKIAEAARTSILAAYSAAVDTWKAEPLGNAVQHVVYSRTEAVGRPVVEASVNDEFDTVRRRNRATLVRNRIGVTQLAL